MTPAGSDIGEYY